MLAEFSGAKALLQELRSYAMAEMHPDWCAFILLRQGEISGIMTREARQMESIVSGIEGVFRPLVQISVTFLEAIGVIVLVIAAVKAMLGFFRKDDHVRLELAQGIALSLEFKLGGEVLRTAVVRDWSELGILGAIILLRVAMTLLIHWEIKNEEKRCL